MNKPSEAKTVGHTPGPWHVVKETSDAIIRYSDGEFVSYVARIYDGTLCPEHGTVDANARLIAAAPELLQACRAALYLLLTGIEEDCKQEIKQLKAAIAKAEGRQ